MTRQEEIEQLEARLAFLRSERPGLAQGQVWMTSYGVRIILRNIRRMRQSNFLCICAMDGAIEEDCAREGSVPDPDWVFLGLMHTMAMPAPEESP